VSPIGLEEAAAALVEVGAWMDGRGWLPATAGNLSVRLGSGRIAITRSGPHKGRLSPRDVIEVELDGQALREGDRPSAETLLHCRRYRADPAVGAVLHGHSVAGTVLSRQLPGPSLVFEGYELLKAFGLASHAIQAELPMVENSQDIASLGSLIEDRLGEQRPCAVLPGYLIRGHGTYAWGLDLEAARNRLEAIEFLLACEIEARRGSAPPTP